MLHVIQNVQATKFSRSAQNSTELQNISIVEKQLDACERITFHIVCSSEKPLAHFPAEKHLLPAMSFKVCTLQLTVFPSQL
jgi:hypothetical protein